METFNKPELAVYGAAGSMTAADLLVTLADLGGVYGRATAADAKRAYSRIADAQRFGLVNRESAERLAGLVYSSVRYSELIRNRRVSK